jgi:hypothetical protein
MGDWCGIVLDYARNLKPRNNGRERSIMHYHMERRKEKDSDRIRLSLDYVPFNG